MINSFDELKHLAVTYFVFFADQARTFLSYRFAIFLNVVADVLEFIRQRRANRLANRRPLRICWFRFTVLAIIAISFAYFVLDDRFGPIDPNENQAVVQFAQKITSFGKSEWILYPTGLLLIFTGFMNWKNLSHRSLAAWSNRAQICWFVFISVGGAGLIAVLIKQMVGRARPHLFEEHGMAFFKSWSFSYDYASFPSGHATTAAAFCTVVALLFPRIRILAIAVLLWTAASRSLIHVHYPSDVVAGSALGIWFSYFVAGHFAKSGLLFTFDANNNLRPKRGLFWANCKYERAMKQRLKRFDERFPGSEQAISVGARAN